MKLFRLLDLDSNKVYEVKAKNWVEAMFKVSAISGEANVQVIAEQ